MFSHQAHRAVLCAAFASAFVAFLSPLAAAEQNVEPQTLFTNVNVFDGESETLAEGMSVLVEGNLIKGHCQTKLA